jgi:TM2 domain-containing membrane protein YozV
MAQAASPHAPEAKLSSGQKICDACGEQIHARAEICPKCGVRQRQPVSKAVLLLLTFFGGGLGAHKFYLGKYWQGALYLLFFWTGIPGLVALIEFIIYAFTSSERLNEKYTAGGSGLVIAIVLVLAFIGVMVIGILAAVAIPAYQDYTVRAKVAQGIIGTTPWRSAIADYYAQTKRAPASANELPGGVPPAQNRSGTIALGSGGVLTLTLNESLGSRFAGKTIIFQPAVNPDGALSWNCTAGTLEPRYRPASCRP